MRKTPRPAGKPGGYDYRQRAYRPSDTSQHYPHSPRHEGAEDYPATPPRRSAKGSQEG